jgi:hypothetical protein
MMKVAFGVHLGFREPRVNISSIYYALHLNFNRLITFIIPVMQGICQNNSEEAIVILVAILKRAVSATTSWRGILFSSKLQILSFFGEIGHGYFMLHPSFHPIVLIEILVREIHEVFIKLV